MEREQAERLATERNEEGTDGVRFIAREQSPGDWAVMRLRVDGLKGAGPLKGTVESRPRPEVPPDPRSGIMRDVPPYGAG
jgi:hypothetical protein